MAVVLRLTRAGVRGHPHYRVVAANKVRSRDGKFIEVVGTYSPVNPPVVKLEEARVKHWLSVGANPSSVVRDIIKKALPGVIESRETHKIEKVKAARKARKARAKKSAKK